jgi:hypothetical protein
MPKQSQQPSGCAAQNAFGWSVFAPGYFFFFSQVRAEVSFLYKINKLLRSGWMGLCFFFSLFFHMAMTSKRGDSNHRGDFSRVRRFCRNCGTACTPTTSHVVALVPAYIPNCKGDGGDMATSRLEAIKKFRGIRPDDASECNRARLGPHLQREFDASRHFNRLFKQTGTSWASMDNNGAVAGEEHFYGHDYLILCDACAANPSADRQRVIARF